MLRRGNLMRGITYVYALSQQSMGARIKQPQVKASSLMAALHVLDHSSLAHQIVYVADKSLHIPVLKLRNCGFHEKESFRSIYLQVSIHQVTIVLPDLARRCRLLTQCIMSVKLIQ